MHEISIMQSTLELAGEQMEKARCREIHSIKLSVGVLSGVVPEALVFAFDALKQGTAAANATIEIEMAPARCFCPACNLELDAMGFDCPQCGAQLDLLGGGTDLELTEMQIS